MIIMQKRNKGSSQVEVFMFYEYIHLQIPYTFSIADELPIEVKLLALNWFDIHF